MERLACINHAATNYVLHHYFVLSFKKRYAQQLEPEKLAAAIFDLITDKDNENSNKEA